MHRRHLSVVGLEDFVNKKEYSTLRLLSQRPPRLTESVSRAEVGREEALASSHPRGVQDSDRPKELDRREEFPEGHAANQDRNHPETTARRERHTCVLQGAGCRTRQRTVGRLRVRRAVRARRLHRGSANSTLRRHRQRLVHRPSEHQISVSVRPPAAV